MKKKLLLCGAVLCCLLCVSGTAFAMGVQGSGRIVRETRGVKNFSSVSFTTSGKLIIEQGSSESISVETDENLLPYYVTVVRNGVLYIEESEPMLKLPSHEVIFRLKVRTIESIEHNSSGEITVSDLTAKDLKCKSSGSGSMNIESVSADNFEGDVSGSGSMKIDSLSASVVSLSTHGSGGLNIDTLSANSFDLEVSGSGGFDSRSAFAANLEVRCNGSGSVRLAGKDVVKTLKLRLSSSGSFHGEDLECLSASVSLTSSGPAYVYATDTLAAQLSGSGSLFYRGKPILESSVTGSGRVKPY